MQPRHTLFLSISAGKFPTNTVLASTSAFVSPGGVYLTLVAFFRFFLVSPAAETCFGVEVASSASLSELPSDWSDEAAASAFFFGGAEVCLVVEGEEACDVFERFTFAVSPSFRSLALRLGAAEGFDKPACQKG